MPDEIARRSKLRDKPTDGNEKEKLMTKTEKQNKIDLMVKELNIDIPIVFDPYKSATDCMHLWDKFTLGKWASVNSYAVSNEWVAKVVNRKSQPDFEISAEGFTMIEAMTECMYRFFKNECQYSE